MSKCNSLFQDKQEDAARARYESYTNNILEAKRFDMLLSFAEFYSDEEQSSRDSA